ncbi:MAG: hypothetical protein KJN63_02350 [Acidimicrobiia bacterium]|nr:hypothetical protein [Acidimicrobiia bacterium]
MAKAEESNAKKPNILILSGDDIDWYNISHNNRGSIESRTPARLQRSAW